MRKLKTPLLCSLLGVAVTLSLLTGCAAGSDVSEASAAGKKEAFPIVKAEAVPEHSWQYAVSFPDWKGKPDNSLAMNSMVSFEGRHGQGSLYIVPSDNVGSFSVYINDHPVDTTDMEPGAVYEIDFSGAAIDGINTIQVTDILPAEEDRKVEVYIPYPTVLEGTLEEAGISEQSVGLISDLIESDIAHGFTSAQLSIIRNGRLVYENAWGSLNSYNQDGTPIPEEERKPVTTDTLYDLASVRSPSLSETFSAIREDSPRTRAILTLISIRRSRNLIPKVPINCLSETEPTRRRKMRPLRESA